MTSKIICTVCPNGCEISVIESEVKNYNIEGYRCEKGKKYADQEITSPSRILTTTIKIKNGFIKRLPVRSDNPIPKDRILKFAEKIKGIEIEAPVEEGEIIVKNILSTRINIVASKNCIKGR